MQDRSLPRVYFSNAPVAQLVEHLTEDQGVVGSIPSGSTRLSTRFESELNIGMASYDMRCSLGADTIFYSCVYGMPYVTRSYSQSDLVYPKAVAVVERYYQ